MIDINNGNVMIGNTVLNNSISIKEFINSDVFKSVYKSDINSKHQKFFLKPQKIDEEYFYIYLFFDENELLNVLFLFMTDNEEMPTGKKWSLESEMKLKKQHDEWLKKNIGNPPYDYYWGSISSDYDNRSASSSITIRYIQKS